MTVLKSCVVFVVAWTAVGACSTVRAQYTLTTLATFNQTNGEEPAGGLLADASGNLYGTTLHGGVNDEGVVYEVAAGTQMLSTLVTFNGTNGQRGSASFIADASGNLYSTTYGGVGGVGGTVFELNPNTDTLTTLATFNGTNGAGCSASLIADASGNLYGTTQEGGTNGDGIVFKLNPNTGSLTTLVTFNGTTNGAVPAAGLIADASGNLYSTTYGGGANGDGTVFKLNLTTDSLTTMVTFNGTNNGAGPAAGLIADASGNLYGTTTAGGADNDGTVFKLNPNTDVLTTLISFNGTDGDSPYIGNLIADAYGNLYGTTQAGGAYGDGTVFELNPNTDTLTTLFSFDGTDGENPEAALTFDANGNLYGTTYLGGADGDGTVFQLNPTPEPSSIALCLLAVGCLGLYRWKSKAGDQDFIDKRKWNE